jgi:hypothetical protein
MNKMEIKGIQVKHELLSFDSRMRFVKNISKNKFRNEVLLEKQNKY